MTKAFKKLQTICRQVLATRPKGSEETAVRNLKNAILDWNNSGEDCDTGLFSDEVSSEIELCHFGNPKAASKADANELYQLSDGNGGFVVMTGAELESIVKQWRSFRKGWTAPTWISKGAKP